MQNQNNFQSGFLQVNVFDRTKGLPVNNATVSITEPYGGDVIEQITTDSSGNTDAITLGAPDIGYSLEPAVGVRPYSEYDVLLNVEGFEPQRIEGVQILPDTLAIQDVFLTPRKSIVSDQNEIFILPHTLWESFPPKVPEASVKSLPDGGGFVVLPEPVIPETVIVHDGVPTDRSA